MNIVDECVQYYVNLEQINTDTDLKDVTLLELVCRFINNPKSIMEVKDLANFKSVIKKAIKELQRIYKKFQKYLISRQKIKTYEDAPENHKKHIIRLIFENNKKAKVCDVQKLFSGISCECIQSIRNSVIEETNVSRKKKKIEKPIQKTYFQIIQSGLKKALNDSQISLLLKSNGYIYHKTMKKDIDLQRKSHSIKNIRCSKRLKQKMTFQSTHS